MNETHFVWWNLHIIRIYILCLSTIEITWVMVDNGHINIYDHKSISKLGLMILAIGIYCIFGIQQTSDHKEDPKQYWGEKIFVRFIRQTTIWHFPLRLPDMDKHKLLRFNAHFILRASSVTNKGMYSSRLHYEWVYIVNWRPHEGQFSWSARPHFNHSKYKDNRPECSAWMCLNVKTIKHAWTLF